MESLQIEDFLNNINKDILLLDSRSEKEFDQAHIPGAINLPLLNNENRHLVGIEYKQKGREAAVALGFKLVGPHFHEFIETAKSLSNNKEVMIYCWRGGMRSGIMSWILSMAGFKVSVLKGGYKSFRNHILDQFKIQKEIMIVGGHTGSGKTEILVELKNLGEQVIDLEGLANHRGSAFGQLGMKPQPSNEMYENLVGCQWRIINSDKIVWIEGESRSIGRIKIPDDLFAQLQSAPLVEIIRSRDDRAKRIVKDYCSFSKTELAECTTKLKKRLGGLRLNEALKSLEENNFDAWIEILLEYYDKGYAYSLDERSSKIRTEVFTTNEEIISDLAKRLIAL